MRDWRERYALDEDCFISVNVSSKQVSHGGLIDELDHILEETGLPPQYLRLEITESALVENTRIASHTLAQLKKLAGWKLVAGGQRIRKEWVVRNFLAGIDFFQRVARLAEDEGHHPDLHLAGYRNVAIEIWTHAIGGLSENDFILAAKIDRLPIKLKSAK